MVKGKSALVFFALALFLAAAVIATYFSVHTPGGEYPTAQALEPGEHSRPSNAKTSIAANEKEKENAAPGPNQDLPPPAPADIKPPVLADKLTVELKDKIGDVAVVATTAKMAGGGRKSTKQH